MLFSICSSLIKMNLLLKDTFILICTVLHVVSMFFCGPMNISVLLFMCPISMYVLMQ
jgi:hypothetical protein